MLLKAEIEQAYSLQQRIRPLSGNFIGREQREIMSLCNDFIQVISGIRRSGKSTLLRQLMAEYDTIAYFNFEDPRLTSFEVSDFLKLDEIISDDTEAYFFDEIQNVSGWEIYVRQLRDRGKKVFITRSNASLLSKDLGTRLTGRYLNTELFPFSYHEYMAYTGEEDCVQTFTGYLQKGGLPEFLITLSHEVLQNLFKDILLRDIAIRYSIRNTKMLMEVALYLVANIGKETTYNALKKTFDAGSANTIMDYLGWMEDAYLLFFLQKFSWSLKSRLVNPRKVYAIDTGLVRANSLSFTSDDGRLLENAVYIFFRSKGIQIYYFREKRECDFVLFNGDRCEMAVQVCHGLHYDNKQREIAGLREAMFFFDLAEGYIVTLADKDELVYEDKKITVIPAHEFFSMVKPESFRQRVS